MNRPALVVALVLAGLCALVGWRLAETTGERDALDRRLAAITVSEQRAVYVADSLRAAYRVDTVRLRVARVRWDSVRVTDTLTRVDTVTGERVVYVPRAVADTVVAACTMALRTCEQRVAVADSLTALARARAAILDDALSAERRRSRWTALAWGVAGVVVGRAVR